jgi:hypothetical protein
MKKAVTAFLLAALAKGAAAQSDLWSIGTGLHYSTGEYGTGTTTTILAVPIELRYEYIPWTFRISVPYLEISGRGTVVPGLGVVPRPGPRRTTSGLGDVVTSVTYAAYYDSALQIGVDLTGKVKFGTADADRGLGTGENDLVALVEAFRVFDRTTAFAAIGYHMLGSSPSLPLDNVWSLSLGASHRLDTRDSVGAAFDMRDRVAAFASPQRELTGFWTRRIDRHWRVQAYGLLGLADGSPDYGAGLSAAYSY